VLHYFREICYSIPMPRPTTTTYKRYRKYKGGKTKYGKTEDYKGKKKTDTKRRSEKRYK